MWRARNNKARHACSSRSVCDRDALCVEALLRWARIVARKSMLLAMGPVFRRDRSKKACFVCNRAHLIRLLLDEDGFRVFLGGRLHLGICRVRAGRIDFALLAGLLLCDDHRGASRRGILLGSGLFRLVGLLTLDGFLLLLLLCDPLVG